MGSHPWWSSIAYKEPLEDALNELRHREFLEEVAGNPSDFNSKDAIEAGIAEYIEECDADGTCSILDVDRIINGPEEFDYSAACPLSKETLQELLGTDKPKPSLLNDENGPVGEVYDLLDRGQACYIIAYNGDKPVELHFFGMSYD